MRKVLKNTPRTKKYLEKLPKIYGLFLWAKWGMLELPWTGKYNKDGLPLVYMYYDANGCCDEYHLVPITSCSSGAFWYWYEDKATAEDVQTKLNQKLRGVV